MVQDHDHPGGKLIGFGNKQTGTSGGYDRHVYMEDDGQLTFGTWTGFRPTRPRHRDAYNDGALAPRGRHPGRPTA